MKGMPYIEPKDREELDEPIRNLAGYLAGGGYEGRLNYAISSLLCLLLESQGKSFTEKRLLLTKTKRLSKMATFLGMEFGDFSCFHILRNTGILREAHLTTFAKNFALKLVKTPFL